MNSAERHENRYQRRKARRMANRVARCNSIGNFDDVFSVQNLYKYSSIVCQGVNWKQSVQNFYRRRLSICANTYDELQRFKNEQAGAYRVKRYKHFTLCERGKIREIDAPEIVDKLVQKTLSREVLHKLYPPILANNNGASQEGKGTRFSRQCLRDDLREHYRKYGLSGNIILLDFKDFFPSASHDIIKQRHREYIFDNDIRRLMDLIVDSSPSQPAGMPLGIEPSQYEMIAFPSALDHYITCQLGIKGFGHYMDDYYVLVPPGRDARELLQLIVAKADELHLRISQGKTHVVPFGKPFAYCKVKYFVTDTGKVVTRGYRKNITRGRHKLQTFARWYKEGKMKLRDIYATVQASLAYLNSTCNHNDKLKYCRLFYSLFGFSCERRENFAW